MAKIYLGTDHAGFELKEKVKNYLKEKGWPVDDQGAFEVDPNDDYTDYIKIVAKMVQGDDGSRGIIFGKSGQGEAICANRFQGVRAVVYYGGRPEILKLTREHNDANVLSLGVHFIDFEEAKQAIDLWLATMFSNDERHLRRIREIDDISNLGRII